MFLDVWDVRLEISVVSTHVKWMDWVCTWKTGKWKIGQYTGFNWLTSINQWGKCAEEKVAKHRQIMKFCHSHLIHNVLNYCMRRFFFGLVYMAITSARRLTWNIKSTKICYCFVFCFVLFYFVFCCCCCFFVLFFFFFGGGGWVGVEDFLWYKLLMVNFVSEEQVLKTMGAHAPNNDKQWLCKDQARSTIVKEQKARGIVCLIFEFWLAHCSS